ncbi:MAG TPA: ABC transporter ATP-binding protein [Methanomassiliicoccales archaeon]|nr:ABC transporter ATP-binding protein [Methanomassiliicoccales archaeon]
MVAIQVDNLTKKYGELLALKGVSFSVKEGEVFGLIGPNGAGKTTTLRILATLLEVSGGKVSVFGHDLVKEAGAVREMISYLPEDAGAYKAMTGREYLTFISGFFGDGVHRKDMVAKGIEIANLDERINDKVDTYSKGMTRRLLVARALMINPKLAILDELTSGLDVINSQEIRKMVKRTAAEGMTILLSSHNMLEVELMCDRIALVDHGIVVAQGTPAELKAHYAANNIEEVFVKVVNE